MSIANSETVADCAKKFAHGRWSFLGPGSQKNWYGTHTLRTNRMENGMESLRTCCSTSVKVEGTGKLSFHARFDTSAHVNFSRVAQDQLKLCVPHKTFHLHTKYSMSHAPSLLYPSQMSTTSLSTPSSCTPVRPSSRPSTRPLLTLSSHGDNT